MSLSTLLRNLVLGAGITAVGCGPAAKDENCAEAPSSRQDSRQAFRQARERLEQEGYEVRSGLWNNEEQFTRIGRYMLDDLGCSPALGRRHGQNSCGEVGLSSYRSFAFYCGPGAVEGNCDRFDPGDCLNRVCQEHDLCYDHLLRAVPDAEPDLCLWSEQTESCDDAFLKGYYHCVIEDQCGFYCQLITAIAMGLQGIEDSYNRVGPGCLWNGEYDRPPPRAEPKEKEPKEGKPEYKEPPDKKDPKGGEKPPEKEIDWKLRGLCSDFLDRAISCDLDYLPPQLERLLGGDGCISKNRILEKNRTLFECLYEETCTDFRDCVGRY